MSINEKKEPSICYLTREEKQEIVEVNEKNPKLSDRTLAVQC